MHEGPCAKVELETTPMTDPRTLAFELDAQAEKRVLPTRLAPLPAVHDARVAREMAAYRPGAPLAKIIAAGAVLRALKDLETVVRLAEEVRASDDGIG